MVKIVYTLRYQRGSLLQRVVTCYERSEIESSILAMLRTRYSGGLIHIDEIEPWRYRVYVNDSWTGVVRVRFEGRDRVKRKWGSRG